MRQFIRYMNLAVLLLFCMADVKAAGEIIVDASNGTVTSSVSNGICTLTVTPDEGYYIALSDISAVKYLDAEQAAARKRANGPSVSDAIVVSGDDPEDLSQTRYYTFTMPDDDYDVKVTANFHRGAAITQDMVTLSANYYTYDGKAKEPTVSVRGLTLGKDYTYTYINNINAGTASVVITGAGVYAGTINYNFTIAPVTLTVIAENKTKVYGEKDPELTYQVTGFVDGESLTGAITRAKGENVGTYAITQGTLKSSGNYTIAFTGASFTITKAFVEWKKEPKGKEGLVYTGTPQKLMLVGTATGGTVEYSLDGKSYSSNNPSATNAGTYQVWYRLNGNKNYEDIEAASTTVTIAKAEHVITKVPEALALTYTGRAQALIRGGNTRTGQMQYSTDGSTYTTTIPTATNAQSYSVWYRVVGNQNYKDTDPVELNVRIAKANEPSFTAPTANKLTYTGMAQALLSTGPVEGGEIQFSLDGTSFSTDVPTGILPDTYRVWYRVVGDENHESINPIEMTVTIANAPLNVTADDKVIKVGEIIPELTYQYSGFVNGEDKNVVKTPPTISTIATSDKEGFYEIIIEGGEANNYTIIPVKGKLTISPPLSTETGVEVSGHIIENDEGEVSAKLTDLPAISLAVVAEIPITEEGRLDMPTSLVDSNGETYPVTEVASQAFVEMPTSVIIILPEGVSTSEPVTNVINGDGTCLEMNLSNVQSISVPITIEVETVIYERQVTQSRFTVCLPYLTQVPFGFRAFSLIQDQGGSALFEEVTNGILEAFQPYVLQETGSANARRRSEATMGTIIDLSGSNAVIDPTRPEEIVEKGELKMFGCVTGLTHAEGLEKQAYIMQPDYNWEMTASSAPEDADKVYLAPFQAYMCYVGTAPLENIESEFGGLYTLEGISFNESKNWATYYASENLEKPDGVTAYVVDGFNETEVFVSAIDYIPAGVGVLLYSESATDHLSTIDYKGEEKAYFSLLSGSLSDQTLKDEEGYVLYNNQFVLTSGGPLPANRCYLPLTGTNARRHGASLIINVKNNATGINKIGLMKEDTDESWYTLDGRKLNQRPVRKGIYIRNGQKAFVK